ncbi:MAG: gephyrin-like molybdotransferase Glp [Paracoccaceae bacterium]|nr:gephyrin-like molybdotransferase Glp [Paracoccaceae bacterium]
MRFERVAILDWSAAGVPKRGRDSIWLGLAAGGGVAVENLATRAEAEARLRGLVAQTLAAGERLLIGADFAFGYPSGFARALTGQPYALAVWDHLAREVTDSPGNASNYRTVAARINAGFSGDGPFWGNGAKAETPGLPRLKPALPDGLAAHRATDLAGRGGGGWPKPVWQLAGAGAVGAQVLTGLPALQRLRRDFAGKIAVWPFEEAAGAAVVLAEVYPSLLAMDVRAHLATNPDMATDEAQVRLLAEAYARLSASGDLAALFAPLAPAEVLAEEGWILGAGQVMTLRGALPARATPPRLRNDTFAMPQGVDWVPVEGALARLRAALTPLAPSETLPVARAAGRILATDVNARRANPPQANSAVDGYGFAHCATSTGPQRLPLIDGRAAAGQPYAGAVPQGAAVRILTGATLPKGVDCVVMEEDTAIDGGGVVFDGPVKPHMNTRDAGEDVDAGALALAAGHRLRAPDLALLSALGVARVSVHRPLRVGVLSTGDEIVPDPALNALPHQIWDANRPMLLALAAAWGCIPVDLGHVGDDRRKIAARLDRGAAKTDVILTSGGASAGDEDHVSMLLRTRGVLSSWRIAMKPGRPLALALWQGVPVFGLPGNPVAAFTCALIFARPALSLMGGGGWSEPQSFAVPAAFAKRKKAGRREYLRARLDDRGHAEVFASEGSGRISGLSWATGLVELPDAAVDVKPGDMVRFLPYGSFGL